jgi:beta-lactamase regulating signal transducer with metallopeptidase domain
MRTLVEYALANAAAATLLAVLAFAIGLVVRRPAVRNALWILVLVRLLLPPMWTVPISLPATDPVNDVPAVAEVAEPIPRSAGEDVQSADVFTSDLAPDVSPTPTPAASVPEPPAPPAEQSRRISTFTVAAVIWITGTALVLLRSGLRIARFHRALRDAVPAPESIQWQANELARAIGLRRCPLIRFVPGRVSPALWLPGLFARQATVIVPAGLVAVLDDRQRAAVLAHELAHLRRGDPWVRWLELVVAALYWWFPLVGWFRRELRASEEECCDMRVVAAVGGRREYATALVETAAFLGDSGPVPALASGAGPVKHLQRRVTMIMRATWPARLTRLGLAAVLGLGGLGLAFGPAVAQDRVRDEKRDVERRDRDAQDRTDGKDARREDPRSRDRVRDEPPPGGRGEREAIAKAREAVEHARKVAREAMEQLREAEEALARAEGRAGPPREENRRDPGAGRRPETPLPPVPPGTPGRPGNAVPPTPPGLPGGPPGAGYPGRPGAAGPPAEFRELQQQIEELRRALEQMRAELRRERGVDRGDRKEPEPRRERKDEPRRENRELDRPEF